MNAPMVAAFDPDGRVPWTTWVEALPDPTWIVALPGRQVVAINDAALRLLGRPRDALIGQRADELMATPEDQAFWSEDPAATGARLESDTLLHGPEGQVLHVRRSIRPIGDGGAATHCVVVLVDRSAQVRAESQLEESVAELRATLESTADGILVTDLAGRLRAANRRFAQLWAMPDDLLAPGQDEAVHAWMQRSVVDPDAYTQRLRAVQQATLMYATEQIELLSGQVLERVSRPLWSRGRPLGRVFSFRDLTERLRADATIESLSGSDALTGLHNRSRFAIKVDEEVQAMQHDGDAFALLLVDLDRFRRVNDSLGQAQGDQVLREATTRLRRCLRQGDELARLGGDQFALLLRHGDANAAEAAARRVLDAVAQPWQVEGADFTMTCSVGVALCPGHGRSADELLRQAETAMRQAKAAGSNNWRFHQRQSGSDLRSQMRLDHAMRQALASGRFRLHYQPQVDIASGTVVGAEALIRWRDPEQGEIAPGRFIPVAEDTGFIIAIGDWVLSQAARQASHWLRQGLNLPIAVNVSALQFQQPQFVDRVADVLREHGLPGDRLELELTESILLRDAADALQRLQALAALGVRLSIDDFGTGYSSLSYLKRFPIDKLKIDRSFIRGLPGDARDAGIVRAIVQMAQALGMRAIAEGVETEPQHRFLADAGCALFQGFLYAPALDAVSFERRLRASLSPLPREEPPPLRRVR